MEYNRKAHSVYLLTYHIVFVTKYRRPVISDEIGYFMKNHAAYLCGRFGDASRCGTFQAGGDPEDAAFKRSQGRVY